MKKFINIQTGYTAICIGLIIMFISLFMRIDELENQNNKLSSLVEAQGTQIIQCNEELNSIYGRYLELEEKNMVLEAKNKIYEKKSETKENN